MPYADFQASSLYSYLEAEELTYDRDDLHEQARLAEQNLNEGQRLIWDAIYDKLNSIIAGDISSGSRLFFIDGRGKIGKTSLHNLLLASERGAGGVALAVASSRITALLLNGGRTTHLRFKIPINVDENSTCNLPVNSKAARLIQKAWLIIWDEAPMTHRHAFEAVNQYFQDIMGVVSEDLRNVPFGGKLMISGGNFRQISPVVRRGDCLKIIQATLKMSYLWSHVRVMKLTTNMRVQNLEVNIRLQQQAFADWLLEVGEGRVPSESHLGEDFIRFPNDMVIKSKKISDLINIIYGNDYEKFCDINFLRDTTILTPKNRDVDDINAQVMSQFYGEIILVLK